MPKPLRQAMPLTAAVIDEFRTAFGAEEINLSIKAGIEGQPTFHARENGQEVGTPLLYDPSKAISLADMALGPACASCAYSRLKMLSADGARRERHCTRYSRPARVACADWREA